MAEARLRKLEIVEAYDYLEVSRPAGYRAYHLIVRHGEQGRLVEVQLRSQLQHASLHQDVTVFADAADALRAYDAAERHFAEQEHIEVVLIGSDSLDTVRRTHANYVDGGACVKKRVPAVQVSLDGLRRRPRRTCGMACSMIAVRDVDQHAPPNEPEDDEGARAASDGEPDRATQPKSQASSRELGQLLRVRAN